MRNARRNVGRLVTQSHAEWPGGVLLLNAALECTVRGAVNGLIEDGVPEMSQVHDVSSFFKISGSSLIRTFLAASAYTFRRCLRSW